MAIDNKGRIVPMVTVEHIKDDVYRFSTGQYFKGTKHPDDIYFSEITLLDKEDLRRIL